MDGRSDLVVAGVAAACTVALSLLLELGFGGDAAMLPRLAPLAVYFVYLFTKKTPLSSVGPVGWSGATVAVTLATLAYLVL